MPIAKLKLKKNRISGVPPIKSTLTKKQAHAEVMRMAREQGVKPYNSAAMRCPELEDPKLWEGFDEWFDKLRHGDSPNGRPK